MSREIPKNIVASIRQRLLNRARERSEDFNFVLTMYGNERFVYRLGESDYADIFCLKGAMLFLVWTGEYYRPTRDIDFLSYGSKDVASVVEMVRSACRVPCPEDGLEFLDDSVRGEEIMEAGDFRGVRVHLVAMLGAAKISMQIDVGFGDAVVPKPSRERLPTMLDLPAPIIEVYPCEVLIAEKYEAMVDLGLVNSRLKDFYDIWALATGYPFDGAKICESICATFHRRQTPLPKAVPVALTAEFYGDPDTQKRWQAFLRKGGFKRVEENLEAMITLLCAFLLPPIQALADGTKFEMTWRPPGPWQARRHSRHN